MLSDLQSILVAAMFRPLIVFANRLAVPPFAVECAATVAAAQGVREVQMAGLRLAQGIDGCAADPQIPAGPAQTWVIPPSATRSMPVL